MEMLPLLLCSVQLREERLIGLIAEQNGVDSKERSAYTIRPAIIVIRPEYDRLTASSTPLGSAPPQFPHQT